MSLLDELKKDEVWEEFYSFKTLNNRLTKTEARRLRSFIDEKRYLTADEPGIPRKLILSKSGSSKKRTVYVFPEDQTWMLKLLARLLYRYDGKLSRSCYSFRQDVTALTVFKDIRRVPGLDSKFVLKADIHDYFNSIPAGRLIGILENVVDDDPRLLDFFKRLLMADVCEYEGQILHEKRGAMAGVPLASFFANFYLMSLDRMFEDEGVPYFRYSDDILVFADSEEQMKVFYDRLLGHITEKGLSINEKKLFFFRPHEGFEFLGFRYCEGDIDLSGVTIKKMKDKIRRKALSVYRRKCRKDYSFEKAATVLIRSMDDRLYDLSGNSEFTWTRFYFPVITVAHGLSEIDSYLVQYLRFLYSGRHYKGNYAVTYEKLRSLGYTSLVNEYYTWKKTNEQLKADES